MAGEFDDIRGRLESISEELADLAIERLRESIDAGGSELPVDERRLTRARRAVEKAIGILREPDDRGGPRLSYADGRSSSVDRRCRRKRSVQRGRGWSSATSSTTPSAQARVSGDGSAGRTAHRTRRRRRPRGAGPGSPGRRGRGSGRRRSVPAPPPAVRPPFGVEAVGQTLGPAAVGIGGRAAGEGPGERWSSRRKHPNPAPGRAAASATALRC